MKGYNTNLASEYYVLAALYRIGLNAFITLGNKKGIDIVVNTQGKKQITIDVKGLQGTTLFPLDNVDESIPKPNHFIIFLSFLNKMSEPSSIPEIYIVPHKHLIPLIYKNPKGNRKGITLSMLRTTGKRYLNNWKGLK